jgi:hypothetical protein
MLGGGLRGTEVSVGLGLTTTEATTDPGALRRLHCRAMCSTSPEVPAGVETGGTTAGWVGFRIGNGFLQAGSKMNLDDVIRLSGYIPLAIHNETGSFYGRGRPRGHN